MKRTYRDTSRNRLVGISVFVGWETARIRMAKLAASSRTPRVEMTLRQNGDRVRFSARDLFDLHLAESDDELGLRLVRAAVLILWHA